ncbi:hypothetical protein [Actinoplanes sp. OR16]|uniref:hypothetical protein n=1 Tax=Actinoplanes sp. OR16 TaxID=946334 RepID=UPI0015757FE3|nr:hypothetical protein [Actinoplanes sp. OR16]
MTTTDGIDFDAAAPRRLRYFHGRALNAPDLTGEQEYLQDKLRRQVRCLLGYGVAHGLFVRGAPHDSGSADVPAETQDKDHRYGPPRATVQVTAGLGVDALGNQIVVPGDCEVDLWQRLPAADQNTEDPPKVVWLGVAYHERDESPTRSVFVSDCGATSDCEFGWTRETYRIVVTAKPPEDDERCDTCEPLPGGHHPVLWLARLEPDWHGPVRREGIHMNIRRLFGLRVPTVITGVSWQHGKAYTVDEAKRLLGTNDRAGGLRIEFSAGVHADGLQPGVLEVQVIEGGPGRSGGSWFMGGEFTRKYTPGGEPAQDRYTKDLTWRQTTRESLQVADQVCVRLKTAFLLDKCCRPVEGTNAGGRVPKIDGPRPEYDHCRRPPSGIGPWTSGGGGGDVFESWFFIADDHGSGDERS